MDRWLLLRAGTLSHATNVMVAELGLGIVSAVSKQVLQASQVETTLVSEPHGFTNKQQIQSGTPYWESSVTAAACIRC